MQQSVFHKICVHEMMVIMIMMVQAMVMVILVRTIPSLIMTW